MKRKGFINLFQAGICALLLLWSSPVFCFFGFGGVEKIPHAAFTIPAPDSEQVQKYLGLKTMGPFKVSDIEAKLLVIEFMSAVCPHCLSNAPTMNSIYKRIQAEPDLADVKVIAIASYNGRAELEAYKKKFNPPFPVFYDEGSRIFAYMDGPDTPTIMIVSTEDCKVLYSHTGLIWIQDTILKQLKALHKKK
jgi:thiol-disulfide isomerase/thioredoxin